MKDRGKGVLAFHAGDPFTFPEDITPAACRDHPRSSNVGICAYCLKDRLLNLVCSECGEQRLSSCSCSDDLSSNRNSCPHDSGGGSVGRVSFLVDNDKQGEGSSAAGRGPLKSEEAFTLRRSSSSCAEGRRSGIWRVGKLFLPRKNKKRSVEHRGSGDQGQSDLWLFNEPPVSRSRSLRSFRGGENWIHSGARSSSINGNPGPVDSDRKSCFSEAEMRRSAFSDAEMRKSCFSESDARKSVVLEGGGVETWIENQDVPRLNRRIFSQRESDYFGGMDERNFIDLRLGSRAEEDWPGKGPAGAGGRGVLRSGSCRVTTRDRIEMKKSKGFMGWTRWGVFRHHRPTQTKPSASNSIKL